MQSHKYSIAIVMSSVLVAARPTLATEAPANAKPNIVFIFVDDQGYYDLGCYGATEVKTPRIDAMADGGIRFTDYYAAAPICSPSRAGLLTGCYPRRVGNHIWVHRADSSSGIHPAELTIAELFKQNGYATACIGKWHLGFQEPFLPRNQGFDHYFGLLHNLDPVEVVYFGDKGVPLMRNDKIVKGPADPAELTKLYTDEAVDFMEKNAKKPFFLYLPHTMLHHPLGVSEEFKGTSQWGEYGDAIQELDHNVGRLFDSLKRLDIHDNTIVIYASDNGRGPDRTPEQRIRGHKLSTYEGGIRVPAIAWGPGLGLQAGAESSAVVRAMDWYPSLATLAGIEIPEGPVIDGRDISPLLKGENAVVPAPGLNKSLNAKIPMRRRWDPPGEWEPLIKRWEYNDAFFYHGSQGALAAVRWKHWKLYLNPSLELYDLSKDPGESTPVRDEDVLRKLRGMAILFQEEMRLDARAAGQATPRRTDGKTEIPAEIIDRLHSKLHVTFARYGDRTLEMDIYRPGDNWRTLPAIVCIHGGGWNKGRKIHFREVAQALAARGFVTASIDYRLSGEAPFPAHIHDCKAAVRFLRANAKEYGIDPDRIGAIGNSAGGHLAALLSTSAGVAELEGKGGNAEVSSAIQAVVPIGAQTDFLSQRNRDVSRFTLVLSIFAGAIISLSTRSACAAVPSDKPMNVLLLIVDDLNTWLLEDPTRYAGKVVAPNIQWLAKEGVLFHNAYTASPVCSPSRTAFLSGVAPWKSGVSRNGVQVGDSKVLQGVPSLFRTFQDQGYWIGSFGKVSHGYDTGVTYDASMNHMRTPPPPGAPLNGIAQSAGGKLTERDWGATHLDENEMSDKRLADAAIEALRQEHDKPFFIACGLFHPHYPWYVPQKYLDMYPLDEIELPPIKDDDLNDVPDYGQQLVNLGWDEQVRDKGLVKEAIRGYLASVTFSDAHMGRVLKALDESPHGDNTIVILISDHGFHLGEKQNWTKGTLWEEATDSVMMWRVPGLTQPNQICTRPVSLLDIYPTLVDLNGIEKPNHLDGHSLLPLLKDVRAPRSQPAITVYDGHMSVRTETARFIRYWDGTTELYDRTKDPHEWKNQTNNPQFAGLKTKLAGLLPPTEEVVEPLPSRQAGAVNSTPRKPKRDRTKGRSQQSP